MVAPYKSYRARVQLECGHTQVFKVEYPFRVPPEYIDCDKCQCKVALYAVECREWRVKCDRCRYTRWAGQSTAEAMRIANRHTANTSHLPFIRYTINPATFEVVKKGVKSVHGISRFHYRIEDDSEGVKRVAFPRKIISIPDEPQF